MKMSILYGVIYAVSAFVVMSILYSISGNSEWYSHAAGSSLLCGITAAFGYYQGSNAKR